MNAALRSLLAKFRRAATGAPSQAIHDVAERLATVFPTDYVAFMQESNGGEGALGSKSHLQLWPIETLVARNEAYNTAQYFPGFVFLGSDGGAEAIALRSGAGGPELFLLPFIGDCSDGLFGGCSLVEFLRNYGTGRIWQRKRG